jgi:hypothetical protein
MKFLLFSGFLLGCVFSVLAQDVATKPELPPEIDVTIDLGGDEPLYLVSSMKTARIITKDQFEKIDAEQVDYIQVIKDPSSIYIYGDKARNGVVLIVMKGFSFSEKSFSEKYSRKRKHR